jgi:UDP-2,3-diacylglucosamine pyrophosphatase LpxH
MSNTLFLSDCHISSGRGLVPRKKGEYPWEWLAQSDHDRLLAFLTWLLTRTKEQGKLLPIVDKIVLLGDIWDGWVFPHDEKPPTLDEILASDYAAPLVAALKVLSGVIPMSYFPGNHDSGMTSKALARILPKVTFEYTTALTEGPLWAEHGHHYDLFNAADPLRRDWLPLGYFISRVVASMDRKTGSISPGIEEEILKLAKVVEDKEALPQGVFDAVCAKAGLIESDVIVMPDDLWGTNPTVGDIRAMYKNLVAEWRKGKGAASAALAIVAACNGCSLVADDLFVQGKAKTVVFGHTHIAKYEHTWIPFFRQWRYLNTGCWCCSIPKASWVETTGTTARLYSCPGFGSDVRPLSLGCRKFGSWSLW